jgi:hypothetical protein
MLRCTSAAPDKETTMYEPTHEDLQRLHANRKAVLNDELYAVSRRVRKQLERMERKLIAGGMSPFEAYLVLHWVQVGR